MCHRVLESDLHHKAPFHAMKAERFVTACTKTDYTGGEDAAGA